MRISSVALKGRGFEDDILITFDLFQLELIELFLELFLSRQFTPIANFLFRKVNDNSWKNPLKEIFKGWSECGGGDDPRY
ncbi:MAG: hypothetical protein GX421_11365 [Caldisericales bacterium]|nr:hypothetical protein [Caldisericales bacterium]